MNRIIVSASVLIASMLVSTVVSAAPPMRFLQAKVKEARTLLGTKVTKGSPEAAKIDEQLRTLIDPVLNFDRMSENALRTHWPTLNESQRSDFIALFRALLFHSYLTRIRKADEAYTIDYESQEAKGTKAATVTAITRTKKAEIELVFHLILGEGQTWVVEDIVIDEVSLVENYREQFSRIISKDGYVVLLQKMADRLVELGGTIPAQVTSVKAAKKTSKPVGTPATAKPPAQ